MPASKNIKQQGLESRLKGLTGPAVKAARKPRKAAGTRWGVLDDWREGGVKGAGENSRLGKRLRDGCRSSRTVQE
jgi:hypothetical protein